MKEGLNTTMGVRIATITDLTRDDIELWRNGDLFIDLTTEESFTRGLVMEFYKEAFKDHYNEELDDHDFTTFDQWCSENEFYNAWDINYWFGGSNWDWTIIGPDDDITLIIAVKA